MRAEIQMEVNWRESPVVIVINLKLDRTCGLCIAMCKPQMCFCLSNQRSTASPARDQLVNILDRTELISGFPAAFI